MQNLHEKNYVRDATLTFLHTSNDYAKTPIDCINSTSLVFFMDISGQRILWTGDCDFNKTRLAEIWESYLKSDIFQIPHHGFESGRNVLGYTYAEPPVCLHPDLNDCFNTMGLSHDYNLHLYQKMNVSALFVAVDGDKTITLPYIPANDDKMNMSRRIKEGLMVLNLQK